MLDVSALITLLLIAFYLLKQYKSISFKISVIAGGSFLYLLIFFWENSVTKIVPDPYLDEIFHIPQAQAYCNGRFNVWDQKLTTPPGLYILAALKALIFQNSTEIYCGIDALRSQNGIALLAIFLFACSCRLQITKSYQEVVHTAFNIALFPPLFFFSGLFYTDVISLFSVLVVYKLVLDRKKSCNGYYNNLSLLIAGIASLTIRQTNIFWTTIFSGAIDLTNALELEEILQRELDPPPGNHQQCGHGRRTFDIPLNEAHLQDFVDFILKVIVVVFKRPGFVAKRIWPYITILISFASFVLWNGGIVLGDKSNHVVLIHLPQMLYLWPFITFFSAPLIIPTATKVLYNMKKFYLVIPKSFRFYQSYTWTLFYTIAALTSSIIIVKYNTIIHPFILADNRHYMFYIFRYTILRHTKIRYFLVPIYLICSYLIYLTFCTQTTTPKHLKSSNQKLACRGKPYWLWRSTQYEAPKISIVLILLITTALSLITCPLVETRYFIVPWVLWRLNIPPAYLRSRELGLNAARNINSLHQKILKLQGFTLWIETFWLLLIDLVVGYIFLYHGFEWPQEPGRVQRFMW
ncbi:putative glycosyltransferase family 59 protein [Erysiphe necator]|uniref:Dol-P-Glc:Glc(2)Man(9)GlcNAc(2)-PP-Dol alpha-1,2-glucosyltransferase n=1 Tax=Uncinula necator TaxID=52586 RepID=A0A0B1PHB0_UNCNE|nr:putative glycosyltransferase family 59 protein [Erysiphe necator]